VGTAHHVETHEDQEAIPFGVHCQGQNPPQRRALADAATNRGRVEDYTRAAELMQPPPSALNIDRRGGYVYRPARRPPWPCWLQGCFKIQAIIGTP